MREPKTPHSRSTFIANRKSVSSPPKKPQAVPKKRLSAEFSSVADGSKESVDSSSVSEVSDSNHDGEIAEILNPTLDPAISSALDTLGSPDLTFSSKPSSEILLESFKFNKTSDPKFSSVEARILASLLIAAQEEVLKSHKMKCQCDWIVDKLSKTERNELRQETKGTAHFSEVIALLYSLVWVLAISAIFLYVLGVQSSSSGPLPT